MGRADRLASVAAPPARRVALADLYDFEADGGNWFYSTGGNPLLGPLLLGELGAIIEPEPVRLHDAAFLMALHIAGGHVASLDGHPIDVSEHFSEIGDLDRTIGPFVAAGDREVARAIRAQRRLITA